MCRLDQDHQLVVTLASLCFLLDMRPVDALVASVWWLERRIQVLGEVWFCLQGRPLIQLEAVFSCQVAPVVAPGPALW